MEHAPHAGGVGGGPKRTVSKSEGATSKMRGADLPEGHRRCGGSAEGPPGRAESKAKASVRRERVTGCCRLSPRPDAGVLVRVGLMPCKGLSHPQGRSGGQPSLWLERWCRAVLSAGKRMKCTGLVC